MIMQSPTQVEAGEWPSGQSANLGLSAPSAGSSTSGRRHQYEGAGEGRRLGTTVSLTTTLVRPATLVLVAFPVAITGYRWLSHPIRAAP